MPYPAYYREMAPMNRAGPLVLGERPTLTALDPAAVGAAVANGARIVDGRRRGEIAAGHIPGSLTVELRDTFASYVGWILPVGTPLVLVLPETTDASTEAVDQLIRIGFDRIVGVLDGGVDRWSAEGRPVAEISTIGTAALADEIRSGAGPAIVDVRDEAEMRDDGRLEDAIEMPLADLIDGGRLALVPGSEVTVACKSGVRATVAAGLLEARGHRVRLVPRGGIQDVVRDLAPSGPAEA